MSEMMNVPDGWEVKKVSDCILSKNDKSKQLNTTEYLDTGKYPIVDQSKNFIAGYTNEISKLINIEEPIVIFGDHTRELKYINFDFCCGADGTQLIKNKNFIDISFLFYALENIDLANYGYDRHFKHLKNSNILIPKEKKEQEKIARILSKLDKAIETTNRLIEKERNIKKALMQELLTNGIDKNNKIRSPKTHTYKPSELGLIPKEWEVVSLKEIAKVGSSKRIFEHEYVSEGVPFYRSTEIILKAHNKSVKSEIHISKDKFEEIEASYNVPQKDDILISAVGTIGVPYLVKNEQFYFKDGNLLWIQNIKINPNYLYLFVKSERFQDEINLIAGGSSQSALTIEKLSLLKVLYPKSIDEQKQIAKILTTQDKKIESEQKNLSKLQELKKGLMSDLLSGKVRVRV